MIKKMMFVMVSGLVLMFTSCGDQHKAQSLVKDFLDENLVDQDCSYERFSRLTPTAMISFGQMKAMRQMSASCLTSRRILIIMMQLIPTPYYI